MDERLEEPKKKRRVTEEQKVQLRANMAKARAVRLERIKQDRMRKDFPEADRLTSGHGAVETLRRLLMLLCSRFGDGRMDKRSCLLCEIRVPPNPTIEFVNPCPCQEGWRYVSYVDKRESDEKNGERREAS